MRSSWPLKRRTQDGKRAGTLLFNLIGVVRHAGSSRDCQGTPYCSTRFSPVKNLPHLLAILRFSIESGRVKVPMREEGGLRGDSFIA